MKAKKIITIILLIMLFTLQFSFMNGSYAVYAADGETKENTIMKTGMQGAALATIRTTTQRTMNVTLKSLNNVDLNKLTPGATFQIMVHIDNFQNVEKEIRYLQAQIEFDRNILEYAGIIGQNGWSLEEGSFNETNGKFILDGKGIVTQPQDAFKIAFRVKSMIDTEKTTEIILKGIEASGGDGLIAANDAKIGISIEIPEEPDLTEEIDSVKYKIEDNIISKILPGTTVKEFKKNVTTKNVDKDAIIFENAENEDDIIATGMKVRVGRTLQFTVSVIGDIDGDGEITVNDLAKVKLHYIEDTLLTGVQLLAADVDGKVEEGNTVGVNDIAQIKLVLIDLLNLNNLYTK